MLGLHDDRVYFPDIGTKDLSVGVLLPVHSALLQSGVQLSPVHGNGISAECLEQGLLDLRLHDTDTETLEVFHRVDGMVLAGGHIAEADAPPDQGDDVVGLQIRCQRLTHRTVQRFPDMVVVLKQEGHFKNGDVGAEVRHKGSDGGGQVDRAVLDTGHILGYGAQLAVGIDVNDDGTVGFFLHHSFEFLGALAEKASVSSIGMGQSQVDGFGASGVITGGRAAVRAATRGHRQCQCACQENAQ